MRAHTLRHTVIGCVVAAAGLLLNATPALALQVSTHSFSSSFDASGIPGGDFESSLGDVAVNQTTGNVYTYSFTSTEKIDQFDASGNPLPFAQTGSPTLAVPNAQYGAESALTVDNSDTPSQGRIYLADSSRAERIFAFNPDGSEVGGNFPLTSESPCGIGVDENSGDFWVSELRTQTITQYTSAGVPTGIKADPAHGSPCNIAVDSTGGFYVAYFNGVVDKYDAAGDFQYTLDFNSNWGVAIDPTTGNVYDASGSTVTEFDSLDTKLTTFGTPPPGTGSATGIAVNGATDTVYVAEGDRVDIFSPGPAVTLPGAKTGPLTNLGPTGATLNGSVSPDGVQTTECQFEWGTDASYGNTAPCAEGNSLSADSNVHADLAGLSAETTYHYRLVVANANGTVQSHDATFTPHFVVGLSTDAPSDISSSAATLNGSLLGDGTDTHYYFEWGTNTSYGNTSPAPPGTDLSSPSGPGVTALSVDLTGLALSTTYHYRVVASNGSGTSFGVDRRFTTRPDPPEVRAELVTDVHSDSVVVHAQVNPGGGYTYYHVEYGTDASYGTSVPVAGIPAGNGSDFVDAAVQLLGLTPGTTYHYRVSATNAEGAQKGDGPDRTFTTFAYTAVLEDPCPNAHVRQQIGAALLLDCRAYELVSAADLGGHDVESNLVSGQAPFGGYPQASGAAGPSRLLYGVHSGAVPGAGNPTNRGGDPYLATRTESGWNTGYVGIPADNPYASGPFSSTLAEADAGLDTFAFGGSEICSPCFEDDSTGIPVRRPDGELAQGMAGTNPQPSAEPVGYVARRLSADGSHLVFGSTSKFEPDGNEGEISIYDRDLGAEAPTVHVVSKTPAGANLPCLTHCASDGIAELDISADGSRIVVGQLVSEVEGNRYWHLYMNIGDSTQTIDLTPGATAGVLYDGMSGDGSRVYFTASDALTTAAAQDTDTSADVYEMDLGDPQNPTLSRVSTGTEGTGDTNSCDPPGNSARAHWNATGSTADCGSVAIGGGGGVASGDGSIYFLSPEKLDGPSNGAQDAPNLYLARPGSAPHFVATLESVVDGPQPPKLGRAFRRSFGSFSNPTGVAADHSTGDVYVMDIASKEVTKLDRFGNVVTSFGDTAPSPDGHLAGTATPAGSLTGYVPLSLPTQLAVDQSTGDLYVPDTLHGVVDKFDSSGNYIPSFEAHAGFPSGVAVDPANGDVYVVGFNGVASVFDSSGNGIRSFGAGQSPTSIAVDSSGAGAVYVTHRGGGTSVYDLTGAPIRELDPSSSPNVAVDPEHSEVYLDKGNEIVIFDSSGTRIGEFGSGHLAGSLGLGIDPGGGLYASNASAPSVSAFGPRQLNPDPVIDNPAVLDAVGAPSTRHTADFQVTPSGDYAAFPSSRPLTGADNAGHPEVYRYDAPADDLTCVSCTVTGAQAAGDASLAPDGLSLLADGRVFFNSTDALAPRDLDNRQDAYEWEGGKLELISTGASPFDSSLLTASADGTDAYFFTRDELVPQDQNGERVKIYDARAGGGFAYVAPPALCVASDECHGPGSQAPGPPSINSQKGSLGNVVPTKRCKPGFVKRHGKCVRKRHRKHRRHQEAHNHG